MDIARYQRSNYGKLKEVFALVVDAETKQAINELKELGIDVSDFARDLLIPRIRELREEMRGKENG